MKINSFILLAILFSSISVEHVFCQSQLELQKATIKTIKCINNNSRDKLSKVYYFPEVDMSNKFVADKVNSILRKEFLFVDTNCKKEDIFNSVWDTKEQVASLYNTTFKILNNDNYILSIALSAEGCGAYCEDFTSYYNFDLKTGNKLKLDSIFNSGGLNLIADSLYFLKQQKVKEKIKEIEIEKPDSSMIEDYNLTLYLYYECLERKVYREFIADEQFSIYKNEIIIYLDRCSAHWNRALDDLYTFKFQFNLCALREYLTPFGNTLTK